MRVGSQQQGKAGFYFLIETGFFLNIWLSLFEPHPQEFYCFIDEPKIIKLCLLRETLVLLIHTPTTLLL